MKNPMTIDRTIGDAAARARNSTVMRVLGPASDIADQWPLFGVSAVTAAVGIARRDRKLAATGLTMTLSMLTATVLKNVVKNRVDRSRPFYVAEKGKYVFEPGEHDVPELDSFPSGHTAGAIAVARALGREYPPVAIIALPAVAAVALAQLPRGKHYPIDLLAGAFVGLVTDAIVAFGVYTIFAVVTKYQSRSRSDTSRFDV